MKHKTGCQSCRLRHRRCVFPKGASQCYGCLENGKECAPPPKFVFETYCHPQTPHSIVAPGSVTFTSTNDERCDENQPPPEIGDNVSPPLSTLSDDVGSLCAPISRTSPGLGLNEREGRLFLLYVRQLAPMMDSCDESRHFSLTVPRMALEKPLLLYSILALASRYDALHRNLPPDLEAIKYNHYCIEYLIDSLSKPPETYGPELLAAVVIARSYEECDFEADLSHHHLSGTSNLLTDETVARLASEGGLAEAACWVHLRQAIYAYLVRRRPVDRHIDAFKRLAMRNTTSDSAYTNSMVYCFARILRLFFPCTLTASQLTEDTWDTLEAEADIWFEKRRPSFEPIYTSENEEQGDFPSIMMMSAATLMGLQYYYAANVVFLLNQCNGANANAGFGAIKARKQLEHSISKLLFKLMGLATSNEHFLDSFLLPTHMLSLCGYCIHDAAMRKMTLEFLRKVNRLVEWTTQPLIYSLSEQWFEMDEQ